MKSSPKPKRMVQSLEALALIGGALASQVHHQCQGRTSPLNLCRGIRNYYPRLRRTQSALQLVLGARAGWLFQDS